MPETLPTDSPLSRDKEPDVGEQATKRAPIDRNRALRVFVVVGLVVWAVLLMVQLAHHPGFGHARHREKIRAIQHLAGTIKTALIIHASDHQDHFPDMPLPGEHAPQSSNQAFRRLIQNGYVNDEMPFVLNGGAAQADGDISTAEKILAKGENHYALAKGLLATSDAKLPLVWEAPSSGSWNPTWDSSLKRDQCGSTWSDGTVLVLRVGGSVLPMKIEPAANAKKGPGRLAATEEGKNLFQLHPDGDSLGPEW